MRSKNAFMKKVLAVALTSCVTIGGLGLAGSNLMNSTVYATEESSAVTVEENSSNSTDFKPCLSASLRIKLHHLYSIRSSCCHK